MIRSSRRRDDQNADRWLISYADFITLLFAFFVVMYSISQVNEGKYRILSQSMLAAFDIPERSLQPVQIGDISRTKIKLKGTANELPGDNRIGDEAVGGEEQVGDNQLSEVNATTQQSEQQFKALVAILKDGFKNLEKKGLIGIDASEDWIELTLSSAFLFASGSDRLSKSANVLLSELVEIMGQSNNMIRVRGFTDNIPLDGGRYRNNWALSAARAASVVQLLQRLGIEPERLAVEGYGAYAPKVENSTVRGRAENRRVVVAISRYVRGKLTPLPILATKEEVKDEVVDDNEFELIRGEDGVLIIRGKTLPTGGN